MNIPLFSHIFPKIGVDFGSSRIRICTLSNGVMLDTPACLAVHQKTKEVLAVGKEALDLQGRVEGVVDVRWPIQHGVVYDPSLALALLKIVLQPISRSSFLSTPTYMVSVPAGATQVERDTMSKLFYDLGAREVFTIAQPLAASIGAGVPIADASGSFILQLGSDIVEAGVTALGSLVHFEQSDKGGRHLVEQIMLLLQQEVGIAVSAEEAERILHKVATVHTESKRQLLVTGKDAKQGNPMELQITSSALYDTVAAQLEEYQAVLQRLLSKIRPELTIDVIDKGLLLSGGLSQLHGLDRHLLQTLGMPVSVVEEPEQSVITGIHTALSHLDEYTESLGYVT
jgi:rod shape-determining protein MreB